MKKIIIVIFTLHFFFLAYLNNFYLLGLPARSLLILAVGSLIILADKESFLELELINRVYILLAVLGLLVSLINNVEKSLIINGELKLVQSYLVVISSYYIIKSFGYKSLLIIFIAIAVPSAVVGFLQSLNFNSAWLLHDFFATLQNKEISDEIQSQIQEALLRAPGLALYAIPQTYMLLSAIVLMCYFMLGLSCEKRKEHCLIFIINILLFLGIFASETRSAMGAAIFILVVTYIYKFSKLSLLVIALTVVVLGLLYFSQVDDGNLSSRVISLDDQSAKGRVTLYKYGLELFLQKPWGYGFNFDTVDYAHNYFVNSYNMFSYSPDEKAHYIVPVHNSVIHVIHTYGLLGLLALFYYVIKLAGDAWYRWIFIIGIFLNSIFHNAGIMANDLFFDIVIGAFCYEIALRNKLEAV